MIRIFKDNPNKQIIREIDKEYIIKEYQHHSKKLRYFGLPSEGFYDILQWNSYINEIVAVERGSKSEPTSRQSLLMCNAFQYGFHNRLLLLRGDINDIILNDKDDNDCKIPYPFELVNLDYGGSILYEDRIRTRAIKKLIQMQKPCDFLLLITSNVREFDEKELLDTQDRIKKDLSLNKKLESEFTAYINWVNENKTIHRQIIHLNYLLKYDAEIETYDIECLPPIYYTGDTNSKLIHYISKFRYQKNVSTKVQSVQSFLDLLSLQIYEIKDNKLKTLKSFKDFQKI